MAIRKNVQLQNSLGEYLGVDCYIRIASLTLQKTKARAVLNLLSSDQSRLIDQDAVDFEIDDAQPNTWAQTYSFLKTTDKFKNAYDC